VRHAPDQVVFLAKAVGRPRALAYHYFDRHVSAWGVLRGEPDDAHATLADLLLDTETHDFRLVRLGVRGRLIRGPRGELDQLSKLAHGAVLDRLRWQGGNAPGDHEPARGLPDAGNHGQPSVHRGTVNARIPTPLLANLPRRPARRFAISRAGRRRFDFCPVPWIKQREEAHGAERGASF
jgi:hypothetical protein